MKANFKILLFLIAIFIFPIVVKADMGAPEVKPYDVVVSIKEGIRVEDEEGNEVTIPYDTKLTIDYEFRENGKLYGYASIDDYYVYIDLSKVKLVQKDVNYKDYEKLDEVEKLYVFDDDCYMFNGPSTVYGKVDGNVKIPVGEIIEYQYYDGYWSYVSKWVDL